MIKKLGLFKIGILWAIIASLLMLYGALESGNFPEVLSIFMEGGIIRVFLGSFFYFLSNFIIFTVPAFLIYLSSATLNTTSKFKWDKKNIVKSICFFLKHCFKLVFKFSPSAIVLLVLYMMAALIRGDVSTDDSKSLIDYGYFIGVIITSLLFGFRDREVVEDQTQFYKTEIKALQMQVKSLQEKNVEMSKRYNQMRNKGKRELAKLEKRYQQEDTK